MIVYVAHLGVEEGDLLGAEQGGGGSGSCNYQDWLQPILLSLALVKSPLEGVLG